MKDNKGFTLVEVIVTITILGIITVAALPMLSQMQGSFNKTKFDTYNKSVESSAKLYTDSYSIDMFGNYENGCYKVPYASLKDKNLLQDIDIKNANCSGEGTYVYVIKMGDKYEYQSSIVCVDEKGKEIYKNSTITNETCTTDVSNPSPEIVLDKDGSEPINNITVDVMLKNQYGYGVNQEVKYEWLNSSQSVISGATGTLKYKNLPQSTEYPLLKKKVSSPTGLNGTYYLKITPINVSNYIEQDFTTEAYTSKPYIFDNTSPTIAATNNVNTSTNNVNITLSDNIRLEKYAVTTSATPPAKTSTTWEATGNKTTFTKTLSKQEGTYYIHCEDTVGNLKTKKLEVKIDKPTAPVIAGATGGWKNTNRIVWVQTPTNTLTSVAKYQYCKSNTNSSSGCTWRDLYNNNAGVNASGLNDVAFYHSNYQDLINAFKGDVAQLNNHYNTYGRGEGRQTSNGSWLRTSQNFSDQGQYYIFFRALTTGGLTSKISNSVLLRIDKTAPTLTEYSIWSKQSGYNDRFANTKTASNDSGGSGVAQVCWSFNESYSGAQCANTNNATFNADLGYDTGSGVGRWVYFFSKDNAGNYSNIGHRYYAVYRSCSSTRINCNYGWDDRVNRPGTVSHGNGWGKKGRYCWIIDKVHESRGSIYKCDETLRTCPDDAWCDRDGRTDIPYDSNYDNYKHFEGHGGTCHVPMCSEGVLCANDACKDADDYFH